MIDPADFVVARTIVDKAPCPVEDCPVSITEEREQGALERLEEVAGYVRGKLIKALTEHVAMAHKEDE